MPTRTATAIRDVLHQTLAEDPSSVIVGESVGRGGGVAGTYGRGGQVSPVTPPPSTLYEGII